MKYEQIMTQCYWFINQNSDVPKFNVTFKYLFRGKHEIYVKGTHQKEILYEMRLCI